MGVAFIVVVVVWLPDSVTGDAVCKEESVVLGRALEDTLGEFVIVIP